jgi:tRNA(adenine34) deaminase
MLIKKGIAHNVAVMVQTDATYMGLALCEARKAKKKSEVPVGAVLISESGDILSKAHNRTIDLCDPTGHAEVLALRGAAQKIGNYRLLNTTLYVTVEPCMMCMGAVIHARIARLVFGTYDIKWGAAGSLYHFAEDSRLNHRPKTVGGVCEEACRALMQGFFRDRR